MFSFICSIINLFNKYLLTNSRMSGTVLSTEDKMMRDRNKGKIYLFMTNIVIIIRVTLSILRVVEALDALRLESSIDLMTRNGSLTFTMLLFFHVKYFFRYSPKVLQSSFEALCVYQFWVLTLQHRTKRFGFCSQRLTNYFMTWSNT